MALEPVSAEEFDTYVDALERLSMEQLIQVITVAQHKRVEKQDEVREQLLEEFRERARVMGISFDALFPVMSGDGSRRGGGNSVVKVKYRDDKGNTWSGRGLPPKWLQGYEAEDYHRNLFFVRTNGTTLWEEGERPKNAA